MVPAAHGIDYLHIFMLVFSCSVDINMHKSIDFEKTKTVKVEYNRFNRKVCEALEIQLNKCGPSGGGMNLDNGQYVDTKFWTPFFDYVR